MSSRASACGDCSRSCSTCRASTHVESGSSRSPSCWRASCGEIASEALSTGATVEFDVPDDLAVVADRLVLDRVVSNLLINAVRYGAEPITLSAEVGDTQLRITVEDSGEGVSEELRAALVRTLRTHRFGERRQRARPCDRPRLRPCARRRPRLRPGREGRALQLDHSAGLSAAQQIRVSRPVATS